jgi:hypothetical protein
MTTKMSDMTTAEFVAAAREHCRLTIKNTPAVKWLGEALRRLEAFDAERSKRSERDLALMSEMQRNARTRRPSDDVYG